MKASNKGQWYAFPLLVLARLREPLLTLTYLFGGTHIRVDDQHV